MRRRILQARWQIQNNIVGIDFGLLCFQPLRRSRPNKPRPAISMGFSNGYERYFLAFLLLLHGLKAPAPSMSMESHSVTCYPHAFLSTGKIRAILLDIPSAATQHKRAAANFTYPYGMGG